MLRARSHRAVRELRRGFGLGRSERRAPRWQSDPSSPGFGPGAKGSEPQGVRDEQSSGFGPGQARSSPAGGSARSGTRAKAREPHQARPSGGRTRSRTRAKARELRRREPPRGRAPRGSRASAPPPRERAHGVHRLEKGQGFGRGPTRRAPKGTSTPVSVSEGASPRRAAKLDALLREPRREPEAQPSERSWPVTLPRARPRARLRPPQGPDGWPPRSHSEVGPKGRGGRPRLVLAPRADSPRTGRPRGRAPY
jgi:hypothetical protein